MKRADAHASEESSLTGSHGLTGESDDELTTSSAIQTPDPASNGGCRLHSPNATAAAAAAAAAAVHGSHQPLDPPSAPQVLQMYSSEPPAGPSRADPAPHNISNCDLRRPASKAPHLNNQTSAATRPQKRPRTSACLAVPSGRARMAAGVGEAAEDSDVENADEESPDWYLPSAADQAEAQSESHEDEDGGFLEDTCALTPKSRQSTSRRPYRDGLASLCKPNHPLQSVCHYKLDPKQLQQAVPKFTAPLFLYEQVFGMDKQWVDIARRIYDDLYEHPPVILDSCPRFSAARRQRTYTTNIRGHAPLPEPLQPSLEDFLGLSAQGLPVWMSELFEAGFFNTVNTRVFPSLKCSAAISHWVANHPDQALPESIVGEDGTLYHARKVAARYNLVPDPKHRVRGMLAKQAEALMGFANGHTRRAGPANGTRLPDAGRRQMLGNAFQTDTVAHLLGPLKAMQDQGKLTNDLVVLSLFDGIAGAAVALEKAGITFSRYFSVEKDWACQAVVRRYFNSIPANARPQLAYPSDSNGHPVHDVNQITTAWLRQQVQSTGIHLIIGGSPCNNITGSNRVAKSRVGFAGEDSSTFAAYSRILRDVRDLSQSKQ
ncbi:hypothetical protein WJX84_006277 [Apatococcus fuscideae]|uniref:DNA (cytosine-5-)-methyltransferase n=1 Tax=Apatococcus fuscideae TaxID=2026836 RepID=A0AAW1SVE5_9CHLO